MTALECTSYTFDPRPRYPFRITAKCYSHPTLRYDDDPDALTLVFAHATGYHKEIWEPTIEHLYESLAKLADGGDRTVKIREAWSIDAPNHGDAAVLNEKVLTWGYTPSFSWEEYGRSIHALLTGLGTGVDVDFSSRKLVGVGHSMGAVSIMLADTYMPELKFQSIILVDPMLFKKPRSRADLNVSLAELSSKRRDTWASHEEADGFFKSRAAFKVWHPKVLDLYIKHGLRDLPTVLYPDKQGVTLKCHKEQEVACYEETIAKARAYDYLYHLCKRVPVHFIYGAISDFLPRPFQDEIVNVCSRGQQASCVRVPKAGHLLPLTDPKGLAQAMVATLSSDVSRAFVPGPASGTQSRL